MRSPLWIGKNPVGSVGFGCRAEGTQVWTLPVLAQLLPLVVCTSLQLQAYGNIWGVKKKTKHERISASTL